MFEGEPLFLRQNDKILTSSQASFFFFFFLYRRDNREVVGSRLEYLVQLASGSVLCAQNNFLSHRWNQNCLYVLPGVREGVIGLATSFLNIRF